ncbi:hypothetical protein BJ878DRAFT_316085 [Calycina marina]|uniref:SYO1-like TPR repeats domain-containing protein n=1 Tax=Calycina marina TaxID=1763456 RepID=A0A9P8CI25_9HELO|nr:hypothetical protein BJ878DRAFT_316085 [Calycina marina]
MAKSKPRNRNKNRTDPSKPIKPPSDPELAALRDKKILPVLKDLQSAELKTRSAAALAIANIIEDTKCRKLLLREQIVRILLEQTLTDSSLDSRAAGWGILHNLAIEEEADFCVHLFRQEILTAIGGIVRSITETIKSDDPPLFKLPVAQQKLLWTLTSSVLGLLTSLGEAQDEIAQEISNNLDLVAFLFDVLSLNGSPPATQSEALSCLTALTEDNKNLCDQLAASESWLLGLIRLTDTGGLPAVAACGVLHNIFTCLQWFDHNTPKEGTSDSMLVPVLTASMDEAGAQEDGMNGNASNSEQILKLALEIIASIATSLQEALEHGSKFEKTFEGFDDKAEVTNGDDVMDDDEELGEVDEQENEDEEDDEMDEDEMEADMERVLGNGPEDDGNGPEEVTLDRLVRTAAPRVLALATPFGTSTPEQEAIRLRALATLTNISWTVSSIDFSSGHLNSLHTFWSALAQKIWDELICVVLAKNTADIELASTITSLAWAVCRSVPGAFRPTEEHWKFMSLYQASKKLAVSRTNGTKPGSDEQSVDSFQTLGVKTIGVLGQLALHPASVELNREIGVFLITVLAGIPETPAADAVEAMNQIFDIYADKSYAFDEAVFWHDGFYDHLEGMLPKAKNMTKGIDKRKFGELRARADEAVLNLGRFLKYKRNEKKQKN